MKKFTSIKIRITIWYTSLMFILIAASLSLIGTLSYQLSTDNIEKNVIIQVTQVNDNIRKRQRDIFESVDSDKDFKNVSIYDANGKHIAGQYIYDVANIPFVKGLPRKETIDGKEYIIYDVRIPGPPRSPGGFWIRGAESVNSTVLFGRSAFTIILFIIPLILLLTAFGGYYITKKAFLPINNIIKTADSICTQNNVKQRIPINPDSKKDELYNLSATLNTMLDKIEALIEQEKQFTSDASHELRTPISVILAQGEYLLDIAGTAKEKELAQDIVSKAKQISKLVSRLLLLARIDRSRQKLNKEKLDLNVVIDVALENMQELADIKKIKLISHTDCKSMIYADETLLTSAITNLISNAIKYGKPDGYVLISSTQTDSETEIIVKDNGIGIARDNLEKIWTRFYRIDDVRNDDYGSSGLGLAMVKSIIELHGGKVFVSSVPGEGSEFRIVLKN